MHFSLFFENKNTGGFYFSEFENFIPQFRLFFTKNHQLLNRLCRQLYDTL